MRIDQKISKEVFFPGLTSLIVSVMLTFMVPYLMIDQMLKGGLTVAQCVGFPVMLLLVSLIWLVSLFLFSYNLPRSIILEKEALTIIQPRYWTPWKKIDINIPLDDIVKVEHHDKRLILFTKNEMAYSYHVPDLKEKNLMRIERVKDFLRVKGIVEENRNRFELVNRKKLKELERKREQKIVREFNSGTTMIRYLLVNWRALLLVLVISSVPFLVTIVSSWNDSSGSSFTRLLSSSGVEFGITLSLIFLVIFSVYPFAFFIYALKKNKVTVTEQDVVIRSKVNPFLYDVINRVPRSSISNMGELKRIDDLSPSERLFKGSWRFPPKHALVLSTIPRENLFLIKLVEPIKIRRPSGEKVKKNVAIENIITDRLVIDLSPEDQKEFKTIMHMK